MFKIFKRVKQLEEIVNMLLTRLENIERAYQNLWDETHPKTMGGK